MAEWYGSFNLSDSFVGYSGTGAPIHGAASDASGGTPIPPLGGKGGEATTHPFNTGIRNEAVPAPPEGTNGRLAYQRLANQTCEWGNSARRISASLFSTNHSNYAHAFSNKAAGVNRAGVPSFCLCWNPPAPWAVTITAPKAA